MSDEGVKRQVTIEQQVTAVEWGYAILDAHLIQQVHTNFLMPEEAEEARTRMKAVVATIQWFQRNQEKVKRGLDLLRAEEKRGTSVD